MCQFEWVYNLQVGSKEKKSVMFPQANTAEIPEKKNMQEMWMYLGSQWGI